MTGVSKMNEKPKRPATVWIAILLLFLVGLPLFSLGAFIILMSGLTLRMPLEDALLSGALLIAGISCFATAFFVFNRKRWSRLLPVVPWLVIAAMVVINLLTTRSSNVFNDPMMAIGFGIGLVLLSIPILAVILLLFIGNGAALYFANNTFNEFCDPPPPPEY